MNIQATYLYQQLLEDVEACSDITKYVEKCDDEETLLKLQSIIEKKLYDKKMLKKINKLKKIKTVDPNYVPSGFMKPVKVTPALADFLGIAHDTKISRTDVTRFIANYVRTLGLYNMNNKKIIVPDAALKTLLNNGDREVTYFNLQCFLKYHFIKE